MQQQKASESRFKPVRFLCCAVADSVLVHTHLVISSTGVSIIGVCSVMIPCGGKMCLVTHSEKDWRYYQGTVRAIERFRSCGAHRVSLGLVAMADTRQEMTAAGQWLASLVTRRLGLFGPSRTLFNFKQKFHPC